MCTVIRGRSNPPQTAPTHLTPPPLYPQPNPSRHQPQNSPDQFEDDLSVTPPVSSISPLSFNKRPSRGERANFLLAPFVRLRRQGEQQQPQPPQPPQQQEAAVKGKNKGKGKKATPVAVAAVVVAAPAEEGGE